MPKRRRKLPEAALELFRAWGAEGGRAGTGAAKVRPVSSDQARAAVNARWARVRAARAKGRGG